MGSVLIEESLIISMFGTALLTCYGGEWWGGLTWAKWLGLFVLHGILCQLIGQVVRLFVTCPATIKSNYFYQIWW